MKIIIRICNFTWVGVAQEGVRGDWTREGGDLGPDTLAHSLTPCLRGGPSPCTLSCILPHFSFTLALVLFLSLVPIFLFPQCCRSEAYWYGNWPMPKAPSRKAWGRILQEMVACHMVSLSSDLLHSRFDVIFTIVPRKCPYCFVSLFQHSAYFQLQKHFIFIFFASGKGERSAAELEAADR